MKIIVATVLERSNPEKLHMEYEDLPLKQIYRKKSAKIPVFCYS